MVGYMKRKRSRRVIGRKRRIPGYLGSAAPFAETKAVDTPSTAVQLTSTAAVVTLNSIATGADVFNRVGRQAKMRSVHVRMYLQNSGNTLINDTLRFAIVYDRQSDGAAPVWADVFQSQDNAGTATSDSFAFTNTSNWNRFKILAEDCLPIIPAAGATVPGTAQDQTLHIFFDRYVKLPNMVTRYVAAAAATPNSGALYLMAKGTLAGGSNPYVLVYTARVTYMDV